MTNTSSKLNGRRFSSLFSWSKSSRAMAARSCFLDVDGANVGMATELTHFDDENGHLSYTSLRDLLPTSRPGSPVKQKRQSGGGGEPEERSDDDDPWGGSDRLPIKNRLVEQAARAYLLPVSSQKSAPDQFFARYWAKLTSTSSETLLLAPPPPPPRTGCIHGCTHGCLSCLPSLLWLDLTRVVHALFSQLRSPSLIADHSKPSLMSPSLVTPSLVK